MLKLSTNHEIFWRCDMMLCVLCVLCVVCVLWLSLWYVRMHSYNASTYVRVRVYLCVHVCILCEWVRMCDCDCVCVWYQLYITIELVRISKIRPIWKVKWGWFKHCPYFETSCDSSFFSIISSCLWYGKNMVKSYMWVCVCVCVYVSGCVFLFDVCFYHILLENNILVIRGVKAV
jgi:hypothetical protein